MIDRKFALLLTTAISLAGCDMAPKYVRPGLPVSPTLPTGPAYAAPADAPVQAVDLAWQDFFIDPKLRGVIQLALVNNRDLRVALANVAQARAQFHVQRADLFPSLDGNATPSFQKSLGSTTGSGTSVTSVKPVRSNVYTANVGVSAWEIDLFGRVRDLSRAAQEQYFTSAENRNTAQIALIAEVATAYVTMAADQDQLRISQNTEKAFGQTLDLTKARFQVGVSSELDVHQAQTSYDGARSDIAAAITQVAQDQNALNLLVGTTVGAELLPNGLTAAGATLPNLPAGLSSTVLLRRPDVVAAEHTLLAANANIGAARAAFFPNISLTAAFGSASLGLSNLFGNGSQAWSVTPAVSLPLFDFGRNKGNLRYAEATRDASVAQYEKAIQTGFREVADALARRGTIDAQLEAQVSLQKAATGAFTLSEARFRSGVDPFLTTLDSQRTLYTADQSLLSTRLVRESNAVELYRALGGGLK